MATIKIRGGVFSSLPTLNVRELGVTLDAGSEKLYVGTATGNKLLASADSLSGTLTSGRIPFATGTRTLSDDAALFWNNTYKRLGIGTTNPLSNLHIAATNDDFAALDLNNNYTSGLATTSMHIGYNRAAYYGYRIVNTNNPSSQAAGLFKIQRGTTSSWLDDFVIDNIGNVGIGTTNPTAVLHLKAGTATAGTAPLKFTSGTLLTTPEAGAIEFLADRYYATITTGAERKTLAYTSDITAQSYPSAGIAVSTGTAWGTSITNNSTNWNTAYGWGNHASAGYLLSTTAASTYVPYTGATGAVALGANTLSTTSGLISPKIYPASDSTTAFQINKANGTTNVLNVDTTNGRVGIGTTSPNAKLEVNGGDMYIWNNSGNPRFLIGDSSAGGNYGGFRWDSTNDIIQIGTDTGGYALNLNESGNVGIGTTSPSELLSLGTAGTKAGTLSLAGATSGKAIIQTSAVAGTPTLTLPATSGTLALTSQITPQVYPSAGIAVSTGSAWGTSYGTSGSGNVALTTSPSFTTPSLGVATATSINGVTITNGGAGALTVTGTTSISGTHSGTSSGINTGDQTLAGLGGAPVGAKYIVQTADATLTNEQALGALATGILKNTTITGVLSIATASDFPILNQNTTGSAATLTTSRKIWGQSFNGSADVTGAISGATSLALNGATSGTVTITPAAVSGTTALTLPATSGTIALTSDITAASHAPVTIGTANGLSLSTQQLSLALASTSATGALSSTDWNTFNNKQPALNGTGFVKISGTTISYDNSSYLPLTGGTMTGGITNSTSINPLKTLAESWIGPSSTTGIYFKGGKVGIGTTSPTAVLHLKAGTATAGTAPLKLTTGTLLSSIEDGAFEYANSHLYFSIGSNRFRLDQQGQGSISSQIVGQSGTSYVITDTYSIVNVNNNDISVTLNEAGTYLLIGRVSCTGDSLETGTASSATIQSKLRRTNNTAADIANSETYYYLDSLVGIDLGDGNRIGFGTVAQIVLPPVIYTTTNSNDIIGLYIMITDDFTTGTVSVEEANIAVLKIS